VNFALRDVANVGQHGGHGEELGVLQTALQDPSRPVTRPLPIDFATLAKTGCRTLTVRGHSVLEICFQRNGTGFHCYIARAEDFPAPALNQSPLFAANGRFNAVAWTDGAHRFVIASDAGRSALEQLL